MISSASPHTLRVTVCELPHAEDAWAPAWEALCQHTRAEASEWLVLPEFAGAEPVWEQEHFDAGIWEQQVERSEHCLARLPELGVRRVFGARPITLEGLALNQGFVWTPEHGVQALRCKHHLPNMAGGWEANWFHRGAPGFPAFELDDRRVGMNICTELWALETFGHYAQEGVQLLVSPRATAAATTPKWLAVGQVAAVRSGAFSLSSNRVDPSGACGGVGWIIDPEGRVLAQTSPAQPHITLTLNLDAARQAKQGYPRNVFDPAAIQASPGPASWR